VYTTRSSGALDTLHGGRHSRCDSVWSTTNQMTIDHTVTILHRLAVHSSACSTARKSCAVSLPTSRFVSDLLSPVRLSSVCLSVCNALCTVLSRLKFSAMFQCRLVPSPSADILGKFYGDRPRGTPPSWKLNARRVYPNIAIFDLSKAISRKRCKIGGKLVLISSRKSYMSFRLVPKSET